MYILVNQYLDGMYIASVWYNQSISILKERGSNKNLKPAYEREREILSFPALLYTQSYNEKNLSRICFKLCTEPPIMTILKANTFLINIFQNLINDFLCSSLKLNNIFQQQIKRNQLSLFILLGKTGRFTWGY